MTAPSALFSPLKIGGLTVPGRVFKAATSETLASASGQVTPELLEYYRPIAQAGTPLIIAGNLHISLQGKCTPRQEGIEDDDRLAGLRQWTDLAHGVGRSRERQRELGQVHEQQHRRAGDRAHAHADTEDERHTHAEKAQHEQPVHQRHARQRGEQPRERALGGGVCQEPRRRASSVDPRALGRRGVSEAEHLVHERPEEVEAQQNAGHRDRGVQGGVPRGCRVGADVGTDRSIGQVAMIWTFL